LKDRGLPCEEIPGTLISLEKHKADVAAGRVAPDFSSLRGLFRYPRLSTSGGPPANEYWSAGIYDDPTGAFTRQIVLGPIINATTPSQIDCSTAFRAVIVASLHFGENAIDLEARNWISEGARECVMIPPQAARLAEDYAMRFGYELNGSGGISADFSIGGENVTCLNLLQTTYFRRDDPTSVREGRQWMHALLTEYARQPSARKEPLSRQEACQQIPASHVARLYEYESERFAARGTREEQRQRWSERQDARLAEAREARDRRWAADETGATSPRYKTAAEVLEEWERALDSMKSCVAKFGFCEWDRD
jgi:hypothetical protein